MNIAQCILYILAGLGAGVVTGLAGLSAAVVITPVLVSLCGWASRDRRTGLRRTGEPALGIHIL